ncbi:MAG: TonB-dependent receptor [Candidatus Solibacter usitatus]|nr:TonB-dependent receptor [Candidatus Solibacter usitatus]
MKQIRAGLLCLLVSLLVSTTAWSQVSTGSLGGQVLDPNGAAVPGVSVVAKNDATGQQYTSIGSEFGLYVFPTLNTGVYTISAEKTGFKKVSRGNVEIRIAQRLDLNLLLEVGDVQQTVTITEQAPLLETSTSERGQNLSTKFMDNLPLFSGGIRNPRAFVNYMAGVTNNGEQSVSGSIGRAQEVLIDGGSALNVESSAVFNFPSSEMFGEFKMLQSNYSAEYGRVGGGIEIYVSKSGTNWLHGAAFHNMRRDIWNANAWARNASTNPATNFRPKERFNETGGSIGGPAWIPKVYDGRNKTFWFFTYAKDVRPATVSFPVLTVPTALMKTGNFSEAGVPVIYDPSASTPTARQPFAGNAIPQARFSRSARNLVPLIPDPNVARLAGNYNFVNQTLFDRYIWSLKFDHAITATNRVAFFFSNEVQAQDDLTGFTGALGNGLQNFQKPYNYRVNHDLNIRPSVLMHTTVGYSVTRQTWDNPNQKGAGSKLGFNLTGDSDALPRVQFSGPAGLSPYGVQDGKVANGAQFNRQWWISQGYTWLRGKHEFRFGGAWRRFETLGVDLAGTNGRYVFNRVQTGLPGAANTGHEFASLLLGAVDVASNVVPPVLFDTSRYYDTSVYFQDNWKVTTKLTLNLGVRYEVPIGWHIPSGNGYSHVDIKVPNPGAGGRPGALVFSGTGPGRTGVNRFYPNDWSAIGPRFGLAYLVGPKTVFRGGWSIYYQGLSSGGCGCRAGFAGTNDLQSDGVNAVLNWDNGIPVQAGYRPPPIIDPTIVNYQSVQYQGPTAGQPGRIFNWSADLQHEIKNFLIDIGYQGNRGTRLNSTVDLNQLPASLLSRGSLLQQRIDSPAAAAAGFTSPFAGFPGNLSVAQALRPFPQYLSVSSLFAGYGHSWYDALQAKVERRFGAYQLLVNYTWSKSLGYGSYRQVFNQAGSPGATPQDYNNLADSKSFTNFDVPHVLNILSTFDLPFGKGRRWLNFNNPIGQKLASGWTVSSAQVYRKGTLIWLTTPGNPLGNGVLFAPVTKANLGSGSIRTGVDRTTLDPNNPNSRWFNTNAFTTPAQFTMGTAAFYQNDFRQPSAFTENLSIVKRTTLVNLDKNPIVLLYRADAFNLFNRTNFGGVVGTVGNANFGRPTGPQVGARIITMGLRLEF